MRFFVDERCGCIAIRDRDNTDPEYPGLHETTEGVVWYRHGVLVKTACSECGHERSGLSITPAVKAEAILECARLNAIEMNVDRFAASGI